jgi:hypothetical protein
MYKRLKAEVLDAVGNPLKVGDTIEDSYGYIHTITSLDESRGVVFVEPDGFGSPTNYMSNEVFKV